MTANTTTSTHNMASSTLSSRLLTRPHLEGPSGLSFYRHQLLPIPTHNIFDTAATPQLIAAMIIHLKSVSARGYFKPDNIANLITSPLSTLTIYCFMAFMAFHDKTVTLGTAYVLGLAISLVMIFETYNTIHAMMMRLEFTLEHIRIIGTYLLWATGPSGLVIFPSEMAPDSGPNQGHSPGVDCTKKVDNAARKQQHSKEPSTSKTKVQLYNDLSPKRHYAPKADENTKKQQDSTIPDVLSNAQPTTYKNISLDLNTVQEPNMKISEYYLSPQIPAMQPKESTFQMTLRESMHRSGRPRRMRSRVSTPVKEYSSQDSYFNQGFRLTALSEDEPSTQYSGTSTPDSKGSTTTTKSNFQADLLRMMLCSPSPIRRRNRKSRRSAPCIIEMRQESEFQMRFREVVWPGVGVAIRGE